MTVCRSGLFYPLLGDDIELICKQATEKYGVPMIDPDAVRVPSVSAFAIPKSVTTTRSRKSTIMFAGLMSLWMTC